MDLRGGGGKQELLDETKNCIHTTSRNALMCKVKHCIVQSETFAQILLLFSHFIVVEVNRSCLMRLVSPRAKICIHSLPCNVYCRVKHCIDSSSQNALFKVNPLHWYCFFSIVNSGIFWSRKEVTTFREGEEDFSGGFNWQRQRNLLWQEIRGKENNP